MLDKTTGGTRRGDIDLPVRRQHVAGYNDLGNPGNPSLGYTEEVDQANPTRRYT